MRIKLILLVFMIIFLSLSAAEHRLGLLPEDPKTVPWMKEAEIKGVRLYRPDSLDYSHGMPPVGWQFIGSCVAWAVGYYYKGYQEYVDHNGWDMTDPRHQFHAKFIYNQINGGKDGGAYISDGFKCLTDLGVAPVSSGSYADYDSVSWPTERGYNDAIPYRSEESYWMWVDTDTGIEALKQHMYDNNDCAVIGIHVWDPFYWNNLGPNHIYDTGDATGTDWGGHAICLVGYNDSLITPDGKGAFRLINSWDTWWGDSGYAWITYEALKSSGICWGYAYYATDKKNYQPKAKVAYKVSHNKRLDVMAQVSISPYWTSRTFFNWNQSKKAQYPYPSNAVILDITEGYEYLSAYSSNMIRINIRDTGNDGITGEVLDYSAMINEWGFHSPSPDTPMSMIDFDITPLDLYIPVNTMHWQSFHRLADNSGLIDLVGDMDTSYVLWTFPTNDSIKSSPIIADIDGDNTLDIVIGSSDDTLYAVNRDGSKLWSYGMGGDILSAPATADLDEDAKLEVIATSTDKRIVSLNGEDASFNWGYSFINGVPGSPVISFIDGDRRLEVVGAGFFMKVFNGEDGTSFWSHLNGNPSRSSPAVGDVFDGDGIYDVVVGQGNSVKFYNGKDGNEVGNFLTNDVVNSSPAIGDIDGDSLNEVVIGSDDDTLYALEMDSLLWKYGTGSDISSSPALGDIDGDNLLEVVFGSNDGKIYALNAEDGSLLWSYPTGGAVISSPALGDINNNGVVDVIVGSNDGYLYAISGNSGFLIWHLNIGTPLKSSPALGDIDNDDLLEIAIGGLDGNLYVINEGPSGIEDEILTTVFFLSKIKSPIQRGTIINYSIPKRGAVNLSIFDITGREIKNLVNKVQDRGEYRVSLGIDNLPNGIYFYRLTHGNKSISRKMVVVR